MNKNKNKIFLSEYITPMLDHLPWNMHLKLEVLSACREMKSRWALTDWQNNWWLMKGITMLSKSFKLFDKSRCTTEIFGYIYINLLLEPMFFTAMMMMSLIITVWSQRQFCSVTSSLVLVSAWTWLVKSSWDLSRKKNMMVTGSYWLRVSIFIFQTI